MSNFQVTEGGERGRIEVMTGGRVGVLAGHCLGLLVGLSSSGEKRRQLELSDLDRPPYFRDVFTKEEYVLSDEFAEKLVGLLNGPGEEIDRWPTVAPEGLIYLDEEQYQLFGPGSDRIKGGHCA